jgi:cysteinyl-tRNA synthetase
MYVCGMTVYDLCHLGHARVLVVFDVVYRYLRRAGYEVTYVRNITDIDDKIIRRANENGESIEALTGASSRPCTRTRGARRLAAGRRAAGHRAHPRDPGHDPRLIDNGHAYAADNGDVYYAVASFPATASSPARPAGPARRRARRGGRGQARPARLRAVEGRQARRALLGVALGPRPPGLAHRVLGHVHLLPGNHFDIHGGGADLQFPHHENEIAQSEGATGEPFVNVWMHNGFVRVNDEKMSKSLGNFFTVREILERYRPRRSATSSSPATTAARSTTTTSSSTTPVPR